MKVGLVLLVGLLAAQDARAVVIEGDLADAEHQRLLEIADRYPVQRTLHPGVVIASRLSRPPDRGPCAADALGSPRAGSARPPALG